MDALTALQVLKQQGYKYTGKRELMVHIFEREGRYLSAKDMLEYMQQAYSGLSFDTVYRNLSVFEQHGIVEATEWAGEKKYRLACSSHSHHHHLICTDCGRTMTIDLCPMNAILGKPENFQITGHKFEIYGRCESCIKV
jgi:Fur family transcriptional regulator, zinc uptake regulator